MRFTLLKFIFEIPTNVIDVTNYASFDGLASQIGEIVKGDGLNVLFNNAGVAPKSTRLLFTKQNDLMATFETNSVAPIMLTKVSELGILQKKIHITFFVNRFSMNSYPNHQALIPLLKTASKSNSAQPMGVKRAAIINMSSILGSISENAQGGLYAYRMSKVALNMTTKSISVDLKTDQILCIAMHPGWVKTELGGAHAPMDVETSCKQMVQTILDLNESHNGIFIQFDGKQLPW